MSSAVGRPHVQPDHAAAPQRGEDSRADHLPRLLQDHLRRYRQEAPAGQSGRCRVHRRQGQILSRFAKSCQGHF